MSEAAKPEVPLAEVETEVEADASTLPPAELADPLTATETGPACAWTPAPAEAEGTTPPGMEALALAVAEAKSVPEAASGKTATRQSAVTTAVRFPRILWRP